MFEILLIIGFLLSFIPLKMSFTFIIDRITDDSLYIIRNCETGCFDRACFKVYYKDETYNVCYKCWKSMQ